MEFLTQIKPISYLKSHTAEIVKTICQNHEPVLITQNGEAKLVLMDVRSFEEYTETLALLKLLALGNHEIESKQFRTPEQVLTDLDKEDA